MDWTLIICIAVAICFSAMKERKKHPAPPSEEEFEEFDGAPKEFTDIPNPIEVMRKEARRRRQELRRIEEQLDREAMEEVPQESELPPMPRQIPTEERSLEEIFDEIEPKPRKPIHPISPKIVQKQPAKRAKKGSDAGIASVADAAATAKAQEESNLSKGEEIARHFDLERAVIYSELLTPKYKEYE